MIKKIFVIALTTSLTLSPYTQAHQQKPEQDFKQLIQKQIKTVSETIEKLSPEERLHLKQAAHETFERLPEKQKALIEEVFLKICWNGLKQSLCEPCFWLIAIPSAIIGTYLIDGYLHRSGKNKST